MPETPRVEEPQRDMNATSCERFPERVIVVSVVNYVYESLRMYARRGKETKRWRIVVQLLGWDER